MTSCGTSGTPPAGRPTPPAAHGRAGARPRRGVPAGQLAVGSLAAPGLPTNASGPAPPPEAGVRHGGFLLEQRTDDIDRAASRGEHEPTGMIESGVAGMVTAEREEPRLGEAVA